MTVKLKELPGPKGIPLAGNLFKLDLPNLHNQIQHWADEHGDVYRLNLGYTNHLVVTRPSMIQKILSARPKEFIRMKKMDTIIREQGTVHGLFNAEGDEWKLHRDMVAKGLDVKHQKAYYPAILPSLERLYNKWTKYAEIGEPFDIQKDLLRFTVDVTTSLAFGYPMNTIEEEGGVIQDHMEKIFPMIFKRINMPIAWYKLFRSQSDREFDTAVVEMNKLVDEFIKAGRERIANNPELKENPSNVLEAILVATEEDDRFTHEQVKGNLLTLLMAGEDTTAHTLAWMLYLLTMHTDIQDEIRMEADAVLGDHPFADAYEMNGKMKYIEAATFESMRFKPVAPIILFEATEEMEIEGYEIKKGQHVLTQHRWGCLQDEYFTNAKDFKPDRWLKATRCPVHNTDAFTPFGGGPRYCPGRNLAILEIRMVLSMLFKNFNIEMVTSHDTIDEIMAFTMMSSPFEVKLSKRN